MHSHILSRFVDALTSVGDGEDLPLLLEAHAKYCSAAVYMPPPEISSDLTKVIEYRKKLVDETGQLSNQLTPYVLLSCEPNSLSKTESLKEQLVAAKSKGVIGVYCALRDWSPEFFFLDNDSRQSLPLEDVFIAFNNLLVAIDQAHMILYLDISFKKGDEPVSQYEDNGTEVLLKICTMLPGLRIIVTHVTTGNLILRISELNNVYGLITPHHLLLCDQDVANRKYSNHQPTPLPLPKTAEDRKILELMSLSGKAQFLFSSDSCGHSNSYCGPYCSQVFTLPDVPSLMATAYPGFPSCDLENFIRKNATRALGINAGTGIVTMNQQAAPIAIQTIINNRRTAFHGLNVNWL